MFWKFENILFVEMEPSKLNNYSTETQQTCYSTMVIKLQSILSTDFYHGVGHGEWCGVFFEDETKKKQKANGRIQTYKLVIRPDQTNNRTIRLQLQDWLVLKIHGQKEKKDTTLLNLFLAPSSSVMLQGMGGSYTPDPEKSSEMSCSA